MKLLLIVKMAMQSQRYLPENDRKCARKATNMHFQSFLRHLLVFLIPPPSARKNDRKEERQNERRKERKIERKIERKKETKKE